MASSPCSTSASASNAAKCQECTAYSSDNFKLNINAQTISSLYMWLRTSLAFLQPSDSSNHGMFKLGSNGILLIKGQRKLKYK
ncbi:hypothetical protein C0J52_02570 [Blattella germanica]|nr:hypothetical protein C0J52_02570 [Blattella germanica]